MFFAVAQGRHEFYVWGGQNFAGTPTYFGDGARYNWDTNTWTMLPVAPLTARSLGVGVWTGQEFFVWGGRGSTNAFSDGALYNPTTNTWRTVATAGGVPSARSGYHGYWTGSEVLVFGGEDTGTIRADGGLYNPATNTWRGIPGRPAVRTREASVWNGTEFVIWGGTSDCSGGDNSGHALAPGGAWTSIQSSNRPSSRWFTPMVFCTRAAWQTAWIPGTREMFVWGGVRGGTSYAFDGRRYRRSSDSWINVAAAPAAVSGGAFLPVLVGAGSRVIGWSPVSWSGISNVPANVVFVYDASTDTWTTSTPAGAPTPVTSGAAFGWTGVELIVWGGRTGTATVSNVGGRLVTP